MKRLLLLLVCLFALCVSAGAAEPTISNMKTDCALSENGTCQITQTLTLEIDGTQTQLRLPLVPGAKKASVAGYNAQKQTDGDCPVLVLTDEAGFSGTRSFTILYTLSGLASEADDAQTLRLPLLSAKWEYPITRYLFTVMLPKPFTSYPTFSSGYYGDVISDYIDLNVSETLISGTIVSGLKDHESLELSLTLDAGYFSGAYRSLSFSWGGMAVILALLVLAFVYWFVTLRSAPMRVQTRPLPPDAALPCDLPFLLCGGRIGFNMLVCHWATLGYLTIFCGKNGRVVLRRRVDMGNERRAAEVRLFGMLFSQGDVCEGASLLYKRTAEKANQVLRRYWAKKLYNRNSGNPLIMRVLGVLAGALTAAQALSPLLPGGFVRWLLLVAAFVVGGVLFGVIMYAPAAYYQGKMMNLVLSVLCALVLLVLGHFGEGLLAIVLVIVCAVLIGVLTLHGGRRTRFGAQIITQALGYRRYLRRATQKDLLARLAQDEQYFYRVLPYAEAMGLGGAVARTLGQTQLEPCDWYQEQKPLPQTASEFYAHLKEALALLELSIRK